MTYILGLDLGTNSIGWACIDQKNQEVLAMGSRIFQEGVDRDNKGKEISKNAQRRDARQLRRRLFRHTQRKVDLRYILRQQGMFPENDNSVEGFFKRNAYSLRKQGLADKLSLLEFGRVLYHLNQRRGFKSTRKAEKEKEDGVVAQKTTELQKEMEQAKCKTLGEYFAGLNPMEQRIRDRYTLRKMYEAEFDLLWDKQQEFHPELTDALQDQIRNRIIFYQRPLKSQAKLIGFCSLEPNKRRCAKEKLVAQKFRILETVNRLSLVDDDGVVHDFSRKPEKSFGAEVEGWRNQLIAELWTRKELTYKQIKKLPGFLESMQFNLEKGGEKNIKGNTTGHAFAMVFGKKDWEKKEWEEQEKIHQVVRGADDPEWLKNYAIQRWGLETDKAEKLAGKTSFQPGYLNYSTKAINNLTPFLEQGLNLTDAKIAAGYTEEQEFENPEDLIKNLRNPIVQHALYELLRLLKVIRKTYGEPEKVRVELARNLKESAKKRDDIRLDNYKRRMENEEACKWLEEMGIHKTHFSILQYKLWKECGETCPYTGDPIPQSALFGASPNFQIEHIIPFSRSLDDSFMNKTLCRVDVNKKKGNQTPYEFYNGGPEFDAILQRLKKNVKDHGMPYNKLRKFMKKEVGDDFISRQLNDTRYISRQSKILLESMGFTVAITQGQATAELRHLWGLNTLISLDARKNRGDHRHHAIDAAVVAMTDSHALHKLSAYNKYNRTASKEKFTEPWEHFRETLKPTVESMLISHRINKRARGALHEESLFGVTGRKDAKQVSLYVIRKPLDNSFTHSQVGKIVDDTVREIVENRLRELGVDPDQKKFTIPKDAFKDLYMKSIKGKRIPIKKVRIADPKNNAIVLPGRNKTAVEPGGNHHVVLYRYKDSKEREKQGGEICTLFEAAQRKKNRKPIIQRDLGPGKEFLMSLAINEMVLLDMKEEDIDWQNPDYGQLGKHLYRVQKVSKDISFRQHKASVITDNETRAINTPGGFNGIKVKVDRIGRIHKAHD